MGNRLQSLITGFIQKLDIIDIMWIAQSNLSNRGRTWVLRDFIWKSLKILGILVYFKWQMNGSKLNIWYQWLFKYNKNYIKLFKSLYELWQNYRTLKSILLFATLTAFVLDWWGGKHLWICLISAEMWLKRKEQAFWYLLPLFFLGLLTLTK